jgi:hypothetical protein
MRRFVLIACLVALIAAGITTTTASAALIAGIGDQNASTFADPDFKKLKVKRTRLIVAWDAINQADKSRLDAWMAAVKAAHLKPLVAFNPTSGSRCPSSPCVVPSASAYKKAFKAFRKRYSFVKEYNFWNETNSATQPTGPTKTSTLKKTAALYKAARSVCGRGCTVTGPDLLDQGVGDTRRSVRSRNQKRMKKWVGLFLKYAGSYPKVWGIHNYGDTNYGRSTGTAFMLKSIAKRGQVWVTETGGIYSFRTQNGKSVFKASASRQKKATTNAYKLARKFKSRIKRLYYYQWVKNNSGDFFDAGIRDLGTGKLRPAYSALRALPKSIWK